MRRVRRVRGERGGISEERGEEGWGVRAKG